MSLTRPELLDLTEGLVQEHAGLLPAGAVIRCVARCRDELVLMGVRDGLPDAVAAMARGRLRRRCQDPSLVPAAG